VVLTILLSYDTTKSEGTVDFGKPGAEDGGAAWQRLAAPTLAWAQPASAHSLGRLAWARWKTEHDMVWQGTEMEMGCAVGDGFSDTPEWATT
jgi:hypothetical protein